MGKWSVGRWSVVLIKTFKNHINNYLFCFNALIVVIIMRALYYIYIRCV